MRQTILELQIYKGISEEHAWDIPLSNQIYIKWKSYFKGMYSIEDLVFERCISPGVYIGKPTLVLFCDGSKIYMDHALI